MKNKLINLGMIGLISISSYFCNREQKSEYASEVSLNVGCSMGNVYDLKFAYLWSRDRGLYSKLDRKLDQQLSTNPNPMINDFYEIENSCRENNKTFAYIMDNTDEGIIHEPSSNAETLIKKLKKIGVFDSVAYPTLIEKKPAEKAEEVSIIAWHKNRKIAIITVCGENDDIYKCYGGGDTFIYKRCGNDLGHFYKWDGNNLTEINADNMWTIDTKTMISEINNSEKACKNLNKKIQYKIEIRNIPDPYNSPTYFYEYNATTEGLINKLKNE
ncbi:hypothetical protein J4404_01000 [Candidatus Woesearchaeota archaeon]|nr:hypothetical protein [Candidatus Woesearchaeota archaeon]